MRRLGQIVARLQATRRMNTRQIVARLPAIPRMNNRDNHIKICILFP